MALSDGTIWKTVNYSILQNAGRFENKYDHKINASGFSALLGGFRGNPAMVIGFYDEKKCARGGSMYLDNTVSQTNIEIRNNANLPRTSSKMSGQSVRLVRDLYQIMPT